MLQADSIYSGPGGQWGVTHDNYGRLFLTNAGSESPLVRVQMNPSYGSLDMPDQANNEFQLVWPIISTPDVQGGLPRLRADSTLNHFTGACGQSIYRGNTLPADMNGDYIICEPVGRLIRRAKVINLNGKIIIQNAYYRQEFIASTDMNFRPVNSYTGPDGNLYIVDMHRGIIQQGNWTRPGSFLRKKIDQIGLSKNIGHGRIYRLVYDGYKQTEKPKLLDESPAKLVTYLDNKNGWWRDNAQKQLVILGDKSVVPVLKQILRGEQAVLSEKPSHIARLHALWTLDGLEAVDKDVLRTALKDEHPQIRKAAIVISEAWLRKNDNELLPVLASLKSDASADVRLQLFRSMYSVSANLDTTFTHDLAVANASNEMFLASQRAMDRNTLIKTYGARLANLATEDRRLVMAGSNIFNGLCVTCHGPGGKGMTVAGTSALAAPVLTGSKRINGDKSIMARIILHGLSGPVDGKDYPSVMPALNANSDEWVASIVNYVRYELGNAGRGFRRPGDTLSPFLSVGDVANIRTQYAQRTTPWTLPELENSIVTTVSNPVTTVQPESPAVKASTVKQVKNGQTPAKASGAKNSQTPVKPSVSKKTTAAAKPDYESVKNLLQKNICLTCHNPETKLIGPAYKEIAKKHYTVDQIVALIQKPNPANWPDYTVAMPPMAHVPKSELTEIARWIKSLETSK